MKVSITNLYQKCSTTILQSIMQTVRPKLYGLVLDHMSVESRDAQDPDYAVKAEV